MAVDVSRAWVWREAPPPLRQLLEARVPAHDRVPAQSQLLRAGWVVWNLAVALPGTAVLYVAAWLLQHPARAAAAAVVAGPVAIFWITK